MHRCSGPLPRPERQGAVLDIESANAFAERHIATALRFMDQLELEAVGHCQWRHGGLESRLEGMARVASDLTISTAFSGVGGAEVSLDVTLTALRRFCHTSVQPACICQRVVEN